MSGLRSWIRILKSLLLLSEKLDLSQRSYLLIMIFCPSKTKYKLQIEKNQEKVTKSNHHKALIPICLFGDEEPESGSSLDVQDFPSDQSISAERNEVVVVVDDDSSWDFKDASQVEVDSEASLSRTGERSISSKLKLDSYLDFYLKLKEKLCFVVKHNIEQIKNARGDAALFGGGDRSSFDIGLQ